MSDTRVDVVEGAETSVIPASSPPRLAVGGEPAGAAVEAVLAAVREGRIISKLARDVPVRLLPPAKSTVKLRLPVVRDPRSYAAAGRFAPPNAILMQRGLKVASETACSAARVRHRWAR